MFNPTRQFCDSQSKTQRVTRKQKVDRLSEVDHEAVIKMIIKGRSPTMRHVSRTHRVALDWLFDRINLDPKIQIKSQNQLADILTEGSFSRDEWNHLLCPFNIMSFRHALVQTISKVLSLKPESAL